MKRIVVNEEQHNNSARSLRNRLSKGHYGRQAKKGVNTADDDCLLPVQLVC